MISKRAKALAGLLVLLSPGGATLSSLNLSSLSFSSLFASGGEQTTKDKSHQFDLESKDLTLRTSEKEMQIINKENSEKAILNSKSKDIDLSVEKQLDNNSSSTVISSLKKVVSKEESVLKVDSQRSQKFQTIASKTTKFLDNYQSGVEKIKEFSKLEESQPAPKRSRRAAKQQRSLCLTKEERKAILEIYKGYDELSDDQKSLFS